MTFTIRLKLLVMAASAAVVVLVLAGLQMWSASQHEATLQAIFERDFRPLVSLQNIDTALKEVRFRMAGVLIYQNTFIGQARYSGPASNIHFRNNLILADGWTTGLLALKTFTRYSDSDYNGFRTAPGAEFSFEWDSPAAGLRTEYQGKLEVHRFKTLN